MKPYGKELILDMHDCDPMFFNRDNIDVFFEDLCQQIKMHRCQRFWWDDQDTPEEEKQTSPHTTGTSAVQFILTSNITIHTLDILKHVYLNIFSCKDFDAEVAVQVALKYFKGFVISKHVITRV